MTAAVGLSEVREDPGDDRNVAIRPRLWRDVKIWIVPQAIGIAGIQVGLKFTNLANNTYCQHAALGALVGGLTVLTVAMAYVILRQVNRRLFVTSEIIGRRDFLGRTVTHPRTDFARVDATKFKVWFVDQSARVMFHADIREWENGGIRELIERLEVASELT